MLTDDEKFKLQLAASIQFDAGETSMAYMRKALGEPIPTGPIEAMEAECFLARYDAKLRLIRAEAMINFALAERK